MARRPPATHRPRFVARPILQYLRYALRQLARLPNFTAVAVLTLALCIGANSAIFSHFHAILLRPYSWPDAERLVYCYNSSPLAGRPKGGASIPDYLDRRAGRIDPMAALRAE